MINYDAPANNACASENLTVGRTRVLPGSCSVWPGLALIGGALVLAAVLSWRRWPDSLLDYGIQLYLPWRITKGEVLYRDVTYLTGGPLASYFNALLFRTFGVSFRTLIFANLAITAGMLTLIYRRFLAAADQLTATMIGLGIVLVFVFQHSVSVGNYNYITPYCYDVLYGLMLAILAVMWLSDWVVSGDIRFATVAGFSAGLVFLTKPEVFLALLVGAAAAVVLAGLVNRRSARLATSVAAFGLAGLVPLLVVFALFLQVENWRASAASVVAAWLPLWHTGITRDPFYQWCMGLDMSFLHLERMGEDFIVIVVVVAIYALVFRRRLESRFKPPGLLPLLRLSLIAPLVICAVVWNWFDCGRTLPLLVLVAGTLLIFQYRKSAVGPAALFPLLWMMFGLALLFKLGVYPRIWHYGFALAMPAFVGAVYLLVWLLPRLLAQKYRVNGVWFRTTICLVLLIGFVRLFLRSESFYCQKDMPVGNGGDEIMTYDSSRDPFHGNVKTALSWIEQNVPPTATLAVLPEGAMINYLSRRVNPTRFLAWVPPVFAVFGQTNMASAFEKSSPDYVVIVARNTSEFGVGPFGDDPRYGAEVKQWLDHHYVPVYPAAESLNPSPHEKPPFHSLQIFKRREADSPKGKL